MGFLQGFLYSDYNRIFKRNFKERTNKEFYIGFLKGILNSEFKRNFILEILKELNRVI